MELLVVGADGLDPRLVRYYREKGHLPVIDSLLDSGAAFDAMASRLEGHDVPHTGPAWTTTYTGLTADQHGVTQGGWTAGKLSLEPRFEHTVFSSLSRAGYDVGSFTMAITFPAMADDGSWMVSGFPTAATSEEIAAPDGVYELLPGDYERLQAKSLLSGDGPSRVDDWIAVERRKATDVLPDVLAERPVDVLFYGTQVADAMGHRCIYRPPYLDGAVRLVADRLNETFDLALQPPRLGTLAWSDEVRKAYRLVDKLLGTLVERHEPERVLLVSDHGFRLDSRGHALLGSSLAMGDVDRPESILEVKSCIERALDVDPEPSADPEIESGQLDADRTDVVREQLDALGYL